MKQEPFKLASRFRPAAARLNLLLRRCRALLAFGLLMGLCAMPQAAQAKQVLVWLLRDLPPLTIFEGPQKGRGVIDQLMPALIASLPEYEHSILRVNRARGLQMLQEPTFTCDPSLLWSQERTRWIAYSSPSLRIMSNGLAVRRQDREALAPFIQDGEIDLAALLASDGKKLGVVAERSYGQNVDQWLKQAPAQALTAHYGNDALGSLLQMQRLGRLSALLGYWAEIRYQAQQQGIDPAALSFYPIRQTPHYQSLHIGCSDTEEGRQVIARINQTLHTLDLQQLSESYAAWLDTSMRGAYREEIRGFFAAPPQP